MRRVVDRGASRVQGGAGTAYGDLSARYIDLSVQYFVTARGAFFCGCMEASAINFHHALEMMLNARLLEEFSSRELQDKFKHNLPKLWREFKEIVESHEPKLSLNKFDSLVNELHKWEDRRYPNLSRGAFLSADFYKDLLRSSIKQYSKSKKKVQVPRYYFSLEAMDELFKEVINAYPVNPEFLRSYMYRGVAVYERENRHLIWMGQGESQAEKCRQDVDGAAESVEQSI